MSESDFDEEMNEKREITSEERLRTLIEASPDPIFMKDGCGRWLEVNHAGLELFQLENVDYRGKTEDELGEIAPHYRDSLLYCKKTDSEAWDAGQMSREEECVIRPDGTIRTYDVFKVPLYHKNGRRKGLVVLGRDITERKLAEEERDRLLEKEQAARAAAEHAERKSTFLAEASRTLSETLDYEDAAKRLAQLCVPFAADWCAVWTAHADGTIRLRALAHVDPISDELLRRIQQLRADMSGVHGLARVFKQRTSVLCHCANDACSLERLGSIGSSTQADMAIIETLGLGSYVAMPLVLRDQMLGAITLARKPESAALGAADLMLAEELASHASLALSNARLYEEARDAIVARDEFLSIASHELRTPCTSLRLGIEVLLRHARQETLSTMSPSVLERLLVTSDRQSRHLLHLVDRLLDVTRMNAGQLDLDYDTVDLVAITKEAAAELRQEATRAGSELAIHAPDSVCGAWDRTRISQVVTNLLSNAVKYGAGKPIDIRIWRDDLHAYLTVADHGIGIATDRQNHIFGRFERAVSHRHYGGLGLGLYICRQIVEAHGGTITMTSAPGEGSTFTVALPMKQINACA